MLRLAVHPKLPVIFVTGLNSNSIFRVEHVDGFLTALPQHGTVAGVTAITTPPVLPTVILEL